MAQIAPEIFKAYDIRGIVGKTLTEEAAYLIGRAFAARAAAKNICAVAVGRDGRLSGPALSENLIRGLTDSGMDVTDIGMVATPMLYFAAVKECGGSGMMITGSHNPPDYNGFKMVLKNKPFFGAQIQQIGTMAAAGDVVEEAQGSSETVDIADKYVARMMQDYDGGDRELTVVWDPGNGSGGIITEKLAKVLPGKHIVINAEIDGRFPNHHPDPTVPKNLEQIIAEVKKQKADLGIAFDGDADRLGVVDDEGHMLFGDQLLVVLARDVLKSMPGATIIADVKASQVLFDEVEKAGGKPLMWKTGHSLIKQKMAETKAPLAGEMSGHTFYADKWYGFDDAPYSAVRLLGVVARMSEKLSDVRKALPQVINTPELRFDCPEEKKFVVVSEVKDRLAKAGANVQDVDGVRVLTEDGWWLLRASNTQAVLVARCEAKSEEGLERLKASLSEQLQASGLAAPDFSGENAGH